MPIHPYLASVHPDDAEHTRILAEYPTGIDFDARAQSLSRVCGWCGAAPYTACAHTLDHHRAKLHAMRTNLQVACDGDSRTRDRIQQLTIGEALAMPPLEPRPPRPTPSQPRHITWG